jgi:hypothetical protein
MWSFHGLVNECLFGSICKALCERESGVCVCVCVDVLAQSKFCFALEIFLPEQNMQFVFWQNTVYLIYKVKLVACWKRA